VLPTISPRQNKIIETGDVACGLPHAVSKET